MKVTGATNAPTIAFLNRIITKMNASTAIHDIIDIVHIEYQLDGEHDKFDFKYKFHGKHLQYDEYGIYINYNQYDHYGGSRIITVWTRSRPKRELMQK